MKKLKISILVIIMIMLIPLTANAASLSCSLEITSNEMELEGGDIVTFYFKINNLVLSDGSKGITILNGTLEYDTDVFEEVKKSSFDCGDDRSVTYSTSNQKVYIEGDSEDGYVKTSGTVIFSLTMKVKEGAQFESTQVKLSGEVTDNNQKVSISATSPILTMKSEQPAGEPEVKPSEEPTDIPSEEPTVAPTDVLTPSIVETPSPEASTTPSASPKATAKTTSTPKNTTERLPQTGIKESGLAIAVILLALVAAGISFYNYKKYKDMTK